MEAVNSRGESCERGQWSGFRRRVNCPTVTLVFGRIVGKSESGEVLFGTDLVGQDLAVESFRIDPEDGGGPAAMALDLL